MPESASFTSPMYPPPDPGERPEQTFFPDPAIDRAFSVVMALATEVYVLRDRLAAIEAQLAGRGLVDAAALDAEPSPAELAARADDRRAFVAHLMQGIAGRQVSKGAAS